MKDDLLKTKENLLVAIRNEGLQTFFGSYPSESVPEIDWNSELEPDPASFVALSKALGVKVLYVNWIVFGQKELDEAIIEDVGEDSVTRETDPSISEHNKSVKELERYVGSTASVRAGFFLDGVFHVFQQETTWYEEFGKLLASIEESEDDAGDDQESKLSERAQFWADKLAHEPPFGRAKSSGPRKYLLSKLAGKELEQLPVKAILAQAENIYEVDVRPSEEQRLAEEVRQLKEKGLSLAAIAGRTGVSRERVSMLLAKLTQG